jgi:hypothetical protein
LLPAFIQEIEIKFGAVTFYMAIKDKEVLKTQEINVSKPENIKYFAGQLHTISALRIWI